MFHDSCSNVGCPSVCILVGEHANFEAHWFFQWVNIVARPVGGLGFQFFLHEIGAVFAKKSAGWHTHTRWRSCVCAWHPTRWRWTRVSRPSEAPMRSLGSAWRAAKGVRTRQSAPLSNLVSKLSMGCRASVGLNKQRSQKQCRSNVVRTVSTKAAIFIQSG